MIPLLVYISLLSWTMKNFFFLNSALPSLIISLGFRSLENICNNRKCNKFNLTRKHLVYCKLLQFLPVYLMLYCPKENKVDERKQIEVSIASILIVFFTNKENTSSVERKDFFSFFGHFLLKKRKILIYLFRYAKIFYPLYLNVKIIYN